MDRPVPNIADGIEYWKTQPASYDGVLGGYGNGTLPRIDSLGSRLFLLHLYPELSTVPSAFRPLEPRAPSRTRALDVGAGVGRVTSDVLLHLVSDVVLLEPVGPFVQEALARARASASTEPPQRGQRPWRGIADQTRSVTILQGTIQEFDPMNPHRVTFLDRVGYQPPRPADDINLGFDVIWCQWCLGHLSDPDLVAFLRRSHAALRDKEKGRSVIVVKENVCQDNQDGSACTLFDEQDSSLTRSDRAWKDIFDQAGLKLVMEQIQEGLPEGLYVVKMYGLR
ncbi:putative adoMet dependent proline di-methyltransferase [Lyophyllum shimeji]|uniref:Alpha N-terminal protein methyltransferase 1 n=1 Tax=Lyophyllum shimeji TaxID=47721 RepID=A0A9P3PF91_LYOSH|nr:putative adoMet dependent proline di-methyltransferase [Lyophyllum shimeji]